MINPNLFISVGLEETGLQLEMIKNYYNYSLSDQELEEELYCVQTIILIFNNLGLSFDTKKIEFVVEQINKLEHELEKFWEGLDNGHIASIAFPEVDHFDFAMRIFNEIKSRYKKKIVSKIGKKNFSKIIDDSDEASSWEFIYI